MIIFLNGTSSAGKTTTAKKIQELYPEPMLHMGIDHFFFSVDPRFVGEGTESHLGYQFIRTTDPMGEKILVQKGPFGKQMSKALHRALKVIVDHGINLVIDDLLCFDEDFKDYLELFCDFEVFLVALKPPLHIVEIREKIRGDRSVGLTRGIYDLVYQDKIFDLEIDTSKMSVDESAQAILNFTKLNPHPTAFKKNALKLLGRALETMSTA